MDKIKLEDLRYPDLEDNFIWNGNDLTLLLKQGSIFLQNCWPSSISFDGLDSDNTESATIELSQRYQGQ